MVSVPYVSYTIKNPPRLIVAVRPPAKGSGHRPQKHAEPVKITRAAGFAEILRKPAQHAAFHQGSVAGPEGEGHPHPAARRALCLSPPRRKGRTSGVISERISAKPLASTV
jgi:hypothetical protein